MKNKKIYIIVVLVLILIVCVVYWKLRVDSKNAAVVLLIKNKGVMSREIADKFNKYRLGFNYGKAEKSQSEKWCNNFERVIQNVVAAAPMDEWLDTDEDDYGLSSHPYYDSIVSLTEVFLDNGCTQYYD